MSGNASVAGHLPGAFNELQITAWAARLREEVSGPVSLGLVFMTPDFFPLAQPVLEIIRLHAQVPLLVGCSGGSLIAGAHEIENASGISLGLYRLPGARLKALHIRQRQIEEADGPDYWLAETGVGPGQTNGWLVFADPFAVDLEGWLQGWNEAYAPLPILGGLASGRVGAQATQLYLDGDVYEDGAVALSVGGQVGLAGVISQGCTPIGEPWTITRSARNLIYEIANRPAYRVLMDTFSELSPAERERGRGNLFVGLAVNEYLEQFHRGDFLIRNLIGGDPKSGILAVGALPRPGQTIQFQCRDAAAATEDMSLLLERAQANLAGKTLYGACLCTCCGRGTNMFGAPHHDAALVQNKLGPLPVAGFFCNGELGPVGNRNFIHGFTASLALFVGEEEEKPSAAS